MSRNQEVEYIHEPSNCCYVNIKALNAVIKNMEQTKGLDLLKKILEPILD